MHDLIQLTACEVVELLDKGEISPEDCLLALEARIDNLDSEVNALPTLCFDRARIHARRLAAKPTHNRGILRGLPLPIKDLMPVAGVRTTFGSPIYESHVPDTSDVLVETLESNGALVYGKTNTPEFGTGGNTFNEVFGATRNPRDLRLSAGGSSGGAAAALACGMAWLAHGSDMAGSLRTPASFCGVASLRPSPGLIAHGPETLPFEVLAQEGPMARTVSDLALLTDAMIGTSPLAALCKPRTTSTFSAAAAKPTAPLRVAFSRDLGVAETATEVIAVCQQALEDVSKAGVTVEFNQPDLSEAHRSFDVLRALSLAIGLEDDLDRHRDLIKPEVAWNVEQGISLSGADIRQAMAAQGRLFETAARFMRDYDLLICPATVLTPFPVEEHYPGYGRGVDYPDYYRWLAIVYAISMTSLPVITLPCGETPNGLPVGIQLVGRPHGEQQLFSMARWFERVFEMDHAPIEPVWGGSPRPYENSEELPP